ncbi:MAG: hypothetical protein HYZ29_08540 [Myxococcales bacterium]|nr:hypothetical protein [Myxococcales bacterium]
MNVVGEIGRCSICVRTASLEHHGCPDCLARFGPRFAELAARVRKDPRFASMCFEAIVDADHRRIFLDYFGADGDRPPPAVRHPLEK